MVKTFSLNGLNGQAVDILINQMPYLTLSQESSKCSTVESLAFRKQDLLS